MRTVKVVHSIAVAAACLIAADASAQVTMTLVGRVARPYHLTYQPGRNRIVGDSFWGFGSATARVTRLTDNDTDLWQIDLDNIPVNMPTAPSDNLWSFGNLDRTRTRATKNMPVAAQRNLPNGLMQDEVLAYRREPGQTPFHRILRYSPDGTSSSVLTTNGIPNRPTVMHLDHEGTWNHDLLMAIPTASQGPSPVEIYRCDMNGNVTLVGTEPTPSSYAPLSQVRGMTVLPNNPAKYGSYAGHLLFVREEPAATNTNTNTTYTGSPLYTMDTSGNVTSHGTLGIRAATATVINGRIIYLSDWGSDDVFQLVIPDLDNYIGDILLGVTDSGFAGTPAHTPGLYRLYWDGSQWQTQQLLNFIEYGIQFKDFSMTIVPEPTSLLFLSSGLALIAARKRRR